MKITTFVLAFAGAVLPLIAQETVKVHLVEVPVTVIDHDGNPIRGLEPENVELFDDGKRQKITAFDAIDFASAESVSAISPQNPNARRSFILAFDLEYSQHKSIPRARVAARKFIAANVGHSPGKPSYDVRADPGGGSAPEPGFVSNTNTRIMTRDEGRALCRVCS
jgi:hypothetical protein